jgi:hypothetical protein
MLLPSRSYINLRRVSLGFAAQLILYLGFTVNMVPFRYNPALGAATLQLFVKWTTKRRLTRSVLDPCRLVRQVKRFDG